LVEPLRFRPIANGQLVMFDGFSYFKSQGWTDAQAGGIMGNLSWESRLNPNAIGDGGSAYGIGQWHPDRQAQFRNVMGVDIRSSTIGQQYAFVNWELNNTEKSAGNLLRSQTTLGGATRVIMSKYERPANGSSFTGRLKAGGDALLHGGGLLEAGASMLGLDGAASALHGVSQAAMSFIPGAGMLNGITGGGGSDWLSELRDWVTGSGFFKRVALALLAFVIIMAALSQFKSVQNVAKAAAI